MNTKIISKNITNIFSILLLAIVFTAVFSTLASAKTYSAMTPEERVQSVSYYDTLRDCVLENMENGIPTILGASGEANPMTTTWFNDFNAFGHVIESGAKVKKDCKEIVVSALELWGWGTNYKGFLEKMGYVYNASVPELRFAGDRDARRTAFEDVSQLSENNGIFQRNFGGYAFNQLEDSSKYVLYKSGFGTCQAKDLGLVSRLDKTLRDLVNSGSSRDTIKYTKINVLDNGRVVEHGYSYNLRVIGVTLYGYSNGGSDFGSQKTNCATILQSASTNTLAYALYLAQGECKKIGIANPKTNIDTPVEINACADGYLNPSPITYCKTNYTGSTDNRKACYIGQGNEAAEACSLNKYTGNDLLACISGSKNKEPASYCDTTFAGAFSAGVGTTTRDAEKAACKFGQTVALSGAIVLVDIGNSVAPPDGSTTCAIEGVGWIVCPIINFMAGANDVLYGVLAGLLATNTEIVQADTDNPAYNAWQIARNLANVGFVIVFLIIIFSQISSIGITNYGVKKMLPRLVISAILVNVSFIICALAVDVSNILGGSVVQLFDSMAVFGQATDASDTGTIAGVALAGGIAVVAGLGTAAAALSAGSLLLPVLGAALLAILVTVFILAAREVVIILLIVLAPLAFLAMLLPNTEDLFKQWRKMFVAMLLVYPMIGLLFGASTLASGIVAGSSTDGLQQIIAIIVLFVPLLLTPSLLQASLKAIPALGGFASKLASGANANLKGSANKRLRPMLDSALSNRAAGKTWRGKDRVKRKLIGAKLDKDGNVIAGSRQLFGAHTKEVDVKDGEGKVIGKKTVAQEPGRRNFGRVLSDRTKLTEKNIETNKGSANTNFAQGGIDAKTMTGRNTGKIMDRAATAGLDQKRVDELYVGRLKGRQINNAKERSITEQFDDAELTVGTLDKILKEEGQLRIQHGAENTAAAAMGVEDMTTSLNVDHRDAAGNKTSTSVEQIALSSLADVSKVGFAAEEATKAAELQIQRTNKESGVATAAIQNQKRAEKAIKVNDTQQEAMFKDKLSGSIPDTELIKLSNQQDAAERVVSTVDEEEKARLEEVARNDEELENLEKRKQTAAQKNAEYHAQEDAEVAERKKRGGDLFESAAAEAAAKAASAGAGKRFDSTVKELAGDKEPDELRDLLLNERPDPTDATKYPGGPTSPAYKDAESLYGEKVRQLSAAETGGLRKSLQDAAQEDYIASSRIQQAEMDKTLGIDKKMQADTPEGKSLVIDATGVGTQRRVQAGGAKRLKADLDSDVAAEGDLLELGSVGRDEALALTGKTIDGKALFDEHGVFNYSGPDADEVWKTYESARKKAADPVTGGRTIAQKQPDVVQREALLRRLIREGDEDASRVLEDELYEMGEADYEARQILSNPASSPDEKAKAEIVREDMLRLQSAALNEFSKNGKSKSPLASSADWGAMATGGMRRSRPQKTVNTFASGKMDEPNFAVGWNIKWWDEVRSTIVKIAESPDPVAELRNYIEQNMELDGKVRGTPEWNEGYDLRLKAFANVPKTLDKLTDDKSAYKPDGRAPIEIQKMREAYKKLTDLGLAKPTEPDGTEYKRVMYTSEAGVVKMNPASGKPIYLDLDGKPVDELGNFIDISTGLPI